MSTAQVDPGSFVRNKEALVQKYQNANMSPDRHASYLRLRALKQMWRMEDVLAELQALTPASVQARRMGPSVSPNALFASEVCFIQAKTILP